MTELSWDIVLMIMQNLFYLNEKIDWFQKWGHNRHSKKHSRWYGLWKLTFWNHPLHWWKIMICHLFPKHLIAHPSNWVFSNTIWGKILRSFQHGDDNESFKNIEKDIIYGKIDILELSIMQMKIRDLSCGNNISPFNLMIEFAIFPTTIWKKTLSAFKRVATINISSGKDDMTFESQTFEIFLLVMKINSVIAYEYPIFVLQKETERTLSGASSTQIWGHLESSMYFLKWMW